MVHMHRHYDLRSFLIYIDSYNNGAPSGRYCHAGGESGTFQSMTQMLLKMEQCLDIEDVPQASQKVRTFYPYTRILPEILCEKDSSRGKKATFNIEILFRHNASWQGTITWIEEGKKQNFRSVLELIQLMNSALVNQLAREWISEYRDYTKTAD